MSDNQMEVERAIRVWAEYQIARKLKEFEKNGEATPFTDFDIGVLSSRILDIFYAPASTEGAEQKEKGGYSMRKYIYTRIVNLSECKPLSDKLQLALEQAHISLPCDVGDSLRMFLRGVATNKELESEVTSLLDLLDSLRYPAILKLEER